MDPTVFDQAKQLRTIIDAVPSMIFVFDEELRILDFNRAAGRVLGREADRISKQVCGDALRCVNALRATEGCGSAEVCQDCVVRNSSMSARGGEAVYQRRTRLKLRRNGEDCDVFFLVTAVPFENEGCALSLVVLEDISELMELRRIVPICSHCKSVRTDAEIWQSVESYMNKYLEIDFSHGICPDCVREHYGA